jgi:hypothetical protein
MMASHRPEEKPPEPIQPVPDPAAPLPAPAGPTTLPQSNVLVGFDWVLALGVLALAFLISSFAVRNSDFWMHLATGRLLSEGHYSFGKDPFSYMGGDRMWVNHSWLYDWLVYRVFSAGGGPAVVIVKATLVAAAAALLLLARKPQTPVFPGVICTGLALVGAAPRLMVQPTLGSMLCIAALLAMLIRMPKPSGSWRFPIAIGILFCLWSNLDQWFFLGPVFLLLYTLGYYLRPEPGEDGVTLLKALGVGVLACMINPHHYHVWALPPELADRGLAKLFADDPELANIFRGVFSKEGKVGLDFVGERENPANLYSLIALLILGLAGFVVNYKRASVGLGLIWAGAVALAVYHWRAVPFTAFVAAPVAAVNLAAFGQWLAARPMREQTIRILHATRSGGRAAVGLAGLIAIACTYAGWLHPWGDTRRWQWDVDPNPSMRRAAEQIHEWRETKLLPPEAHLLNIQPDFANYVAWYAPGEKTFFDYRWRFHRPEAEEYVAVRRYLTHRTPRDQQADSFDFPGFLRRHGITFAVTATPWRILNQRMLEYLFMVRDPSRGPDWALWQVHGRAVTLGWVRQRTIPASVFDRLRFDPIRLAYADPPRVEIDSKNEAELHPPYLARNVWDRFVAPPPAAPAEAEESFVLIRYLETLVQQVAMRHQILLGFTSLVSGDRLMTPALTYWTSLPFHPTHRLQIPPTLPPESTATAVLAVRAARRGIKASPDHPDGYYYLSLAYPEFAGYAFIQDLKSLVTTVSLARYRARLPDDPGESRSAADTLEALDRLASAHEQAIPPRFDLQIDAARLGTEYLRYLVDEQDNRLGNLDADTRALVEKRIEADRRTLAMRDKQIKEWEEQRTKNFQSYVNEAAGKASAIERAAVARRRGLVREAISELYKKHEELQKQLEAEGDKKKFAPADLAMHLAAHAELIELMMYDGRIEEASTILDSIYTDATIEAMNTPIVRSEYAAVRNQALRALFPDPRMMPSSRFNDDPAAHFRSLRMAMSLAVGDFTSAAAVQKQDILSAQEELNTFRARLSPAGPPTAAELPGLLELVLDQVYAPAVTPLGLYPTQIGKLARSMYVHATQQYRDLAQRLIMLHVRLALTYVEQGDMKSAAYHFRQSLEGADEKALLPPQRIAREYLGAIDRAGAPRGASP